MGFELSRHDPDIWMKEAAPGYDYIGTHVNDMMVVAKEPKQYMD